MRIGYVGVGNMGGALARRLLLQVPLMVYDRNPAAVARMTALGAVACGSLGEMAGRCEVVLLCLPTSAHVREALFGDGGLVAGALAGTLFIDQTTGDPAATRAMAAELAGVGLELIDAPVSGGPGSAEAGTVAIMVGGSAAQFARALPILGAISPKVFHAGDVGCGNLVKLVNNLVSATQSLVSLEALTLAAKNGIDPAVAVEIMQASSGRNFYLENTIPKHILTGQLDAGYALSVLEKDVALTCRIGGDSGVPMTFGSVAAGYLRMCVEALGGEAPGTGIALMMDRLAGTRVVAGGQLASI